MKPSHRVILFIAGLSLTARGQGFPSATMNVEENRRNAAIEEIPSCFIPGLLVVFPQQLEILVTSLS